MSKHRTEPKLLPERRQRGARPRCARPVALAAFGFTALLLGGARPNAHAQHTAASTEARSAQFVFVVDDSGSMRQTDPNRLAVFAVRSILGMLDNRDEASVVRLNAARDGSPPPPIEPLRDNRSRLTQLLGLDRSIAQYGAQKTPCTSALEAVRQLLDDSWRPGVAQVVMFLTDGACDPPTSHAAQGARFLDGLQSHEQGLFQFYLLRFRGNQFSPALADLAEATGGEAIEVSAEDPTAILHPFAQALSRSQGYEAYLLKPGAERLDAHRGADRVRLLAVAPGEGPDLEFSIRDARGNSPEQLGAVETGTHRYESGKVFRFAAMEYRPDVAPVTVGVENAGTSWKVVAVPEYRLTLSLRTFRGPCSRLGEPVEFGVDVGTTVCVVAEIRNAEGDLVGGSLADELEAKVMVERPDRPQEAPVPLGANQMDDQARFGVQLSNLEKGRYEFVPRVTLSLPSDESIPLAGRPFSLEVASIEISAVPNRLDLGALRPGEEALQSVRFTGAFPAEAATIALRDRSKIPGCIHAALSGLAEGELQPIHVDHDYQLAVRVSPFCGPSSRDESIETVLQLVFHPESSERQLPTVEIPLTLTLDYRFELPEGVEIEVFGGKAATRTVAVESNVRGGLDLKAVIAGPEDSPSWPSSDSDLAMELVTASGGLGAVDQGAGADSWTGSLEGAGELRSLTLRARARRCCEAGEYETRLGLTAAPDQVQPPGAPVPEPAVIPIRVRVASAGLWACRGPLILWTLLLLLLVLLVLYVINMFRHTRLLDPKRLADRLRPLVWNGMGGTLERTGSRERVRSMVQGGLSWRHRLSAWLRANPLVFGLPGRAYDETVELYLLAHHDPAASRLGLVPERSVVETVRAHPERFPGRLFCSAKTGASFIGVPDPRGRICQMVPEGSSGAPFPGEPGKEDETFKSQPIDLRTTELLRPLEPGDHPDDGDPAGWRIGR